MTFPVKIFLNMTFHSKRGILNHDDSEA